MRVQLVVMRDSEEESWTLLGEDHGPVESVERFLSYLVSIEKSPNTVKAYAHDLKDWFIYLAGRGLDWRRGVLHPPSEAKRRGGRSREANARATRKEGHRSVGGARQRPEPEREHGQGWLLRLGLPAGAHFRKSSGHELGVRRE